MEGFLTFISFIFVSFIIFIIYFNFKVLQFVIQAINLYKKMVSRQDATLKLLLDIRDNTKRFENINPNSDGMNTSSIVNDDVFVCEDCKATVPINAKLCPNCGAQFE